MTKKILVPTDGSAAAIDAAKYAIKVAKKMGYEIIALGVVNKNKFKSLASSFTGHAGWLSIKEKLREECEAEASVNVEKIKDMCSKKGVSSETVIKHGFPHEEIINYVKENEDVVVVVMGASGKDFIDRRILGGVTEKVVQEVSRKLPCPVVVTPCREKIPDIRLDF